MAKFCGNCGSPLNEGAIFCGKCGARVPAAPAAPAAVFTPTPAFTPAPSPVADPGSFAPVPAFTPAPSPSSGSGDFAPVPASFTSEPSSPLDSGAFAPVPSSFAVAAAPAADAAAFVPTPASSTPAAQPWSDAGSFAPAPATPYAPPSTPAAPAFTPGLAAPPSQSSYSPVPAAPAPTPAWNVPPASATPAPFTPASGPVPNQASYAPVPGASSPGPASYSAPAGYPPNATPAYAQSPVAAAPAAYPAKKSNTLLKVVIAFVLLLFVGGALALAGLWYAAQQIKAKATQALAKSGSPAASVLGGLMSGSTPDTSTSNPGGFEGDPCRFLSKEEVSQAIGVTVIRTQGKDGSCSYIAKGDPADMTAKHASAMLGGFGADAQTQKMAQKFAGALFAQQEANDKELKAQAATGEIPVLGLIFTAGHAEMEMKMNRGAFEHIKGGNPFGGPKPGAANSGSGDLTGIGDEAYVAGASAILLRKGNVMARVIYTSCPCSTDNVIPLARLLAGRL